MLLENKNIIIYGAGGAIGDAVGRTFTREGGRPAHGQTGTGVVPVSTTVGR